MKLIIKNSGGIAEPDKLKTVDFCCYEMSLAIISLHQIRIPSEGVVEPRIVPSEKIIKFCPFCGSGIELVVGI